MYSEAHQHDWSTESAHATSEGWIRYEKCRCGTYRVTSEGCVLGAVASATRVARTDSRRARTPART